MSAAFIGSSERDLCRECGQGLGLPRLEEALLDELGRAHVDCSACGTINLIQYLPPLTEARRVRWNGVPSYAGTVLMLVIAGLILLLIPIVMQVTVEPPPNPLTLT